jgi:hypothetical protein
MYLEKIKGKKGIFFVEIRIYAAFHRIFGLAFK